jgi:membrane-associated phospholipid phosphatase
MDRTPDRRGALKLLAAAPLGLAVGVASVDDALAQPPAPPRVQATAAPIEPGAGAWQTWVLRSGSELRLPPPPDEAATQAELGELGVAASQRDGAMLDRIADWDTGAPPYRWIHRAVKYTQSKNVVGNRAGRMLSLLSVAMYDGIVAAWDSKYVYNRARPSESTGAPPAAIPLPASPSYPDEHAVTAGAAAAVLSYIFPGDAAMFAGLEQEAARSRVEAGVSYPSDVAAGLSLGRQVGERVVAWGRADGSDAPWTGSVPTGLGLWTGTNPVEPTAGAWKAWSLTSGSQFRPGPPLPMDSEQFAQDLAEVKNYPRTGFTNLLANFWEYYGGRGGFEYWNLEASKKIFEYRLDDNPPRAAQIYALTNVAFADALIACWDAKYSYWCARPAMFDSSITTVFVTPNHPSYPSAHSSLSGAVTTTLARLFPREAAYYATVSDEVGEARIMAGIHFRNDCKVGLALGHQVAGAVLDRAGVAMG